MDADPDPAAARATVQHVALEVSASDLNRARQLWRLVGFEEVDPPVSLRGRTVWLESGPTGARTQIHLLDPEADSRSAARGFGGHVAVVAYDFEKTVRDLKSAGFTVEGRSRHWGAARAFVSHPGGHTVELMAAPPA